MNLKKKPCTLNSGNKSSHLLYLTDKISSRKILNCIKYFLCYYQFIVCSWKFKIIFLVDIC